MVQALFEILDRSIRDEDRVLLNHTLCALAWARSRRAIETMMGWSKDRPSWSKMLHIPPDAYARVAGFEIEAGTVRDLTLPRAFKLVPTDEMGAAKQIDLFAQESSGLPCARCTRPATVLAQFDMTGFPELRGIVPSKVLTCLECAPYATVFVRPNPSVGWDWIGPEGQAAESGQGWGWPTSRIHIAFQVEGREQVERVYRAGLSAGGRDNGKPGERHYHPGYFAAFLLDPDGNNIEAVHHGPAERSAPSVVITA